MARILRGDIVWADLDPTTGHDHSSRGPIVILSHDMFNEKSSTVIAVVLTNQPQKAGFPLTMELGSKIANKQAWIKISQIWTLSTLRLGKVIGRITEEQLKTVIEGLNEIIA